MPTCPECGVGIQPTWDWCHGCGFDPEGLKPAGWQPSALAVPPTVTGTPGAVPGFAPQPPAPSGPPPGYRPAAGTASPFGPAPQPGSTPPLGNAASSGPGPGPFTGPGPGQFPGLGPGQFAGQVPGHVPGQPLGYGYGYSPPPKSGPSTVRVLVWVGAAVVILLVLPVLAVTLLGKNATSKFQSVAAPVNAPVPTTPPAATWTTWSAPDGSLTLEVPDAAGMQTFPFKPSTTPGLLGSPAFSTDLTQANGFILEWLELDPAYAYDADKGLKALAHGAATNGGGALLSSERGKFAGMESIDFTFEKQGLDGRGLAFVAGHRVYALAGLGPEASTQATFQRFVDSLHLK